MWNSVAPVDEEFTKYFANLLTAEKEKSDEPDRAKKSPKKLMQKSTKASNEIACKY